MWKISGRWVSRVARTVALMAVMQNNQSFKDSQIWGGNQKTLQQKSWRNAAVSPCAKWGRSVNRTAHRNFNVFAVGPSGIV